MSQVTAQRAEVELASVQPAPLPWAGQPRWAWGQLALATDASMLALAVLSAEVWAHVAATRTAWGWAAVLLCTTLLALNRKRLHRSPLHLRVIDTLVAVVLATAFATSTTITLLVLAGDSDDLAAQTVQLAFLAAVFVGAAGCISGISPAIGLAAGVACWPSAPGIASVLAATPPAACVDI